MKMKFGMLMAVGVLMVAQLTGCGRIEQGNAGVRTNWNKSIEMTELPQGFYWSVMTDVDEFVAKEIEIPHNNMQPKAKDQLSLKELDVSVFYKTNSSLIAEQLVKYQGMSARADNGLYYPGYNLVKSISRGAIYDVIGNKYESMTAHNKREELQTDIQERVQKELDEKDPGTFVITRVVVRQLLTDTTMEDSIRAAVKVQKQVEAKEAQKALAIAEAARLKEEAMGIAAANRLISESLTPQLLKMREIEMQAGFAKGGTHTVLMGGSGAGALINVK